MSIKSSTIVFRERVDEGSRKGFVRIHERLIWVHLNRGWISSSQSRYGFVDLLFTFDLTRLKNKNTNTKRR